MKLSKWFESFLIRHSYLTGYTIISLPVKSRPLKMLKPRPKQKKQPLKRQLLRKKQLKRKLNLRLKQRQKLPPKQRKKLLNLPQLQLQHLLLLLLLLVHLVLLVVEHKEVKCFRRNQLTTVLKTFSR